MTSLAFFLLLIPTPTSWDCTLEDFLIPLSVKGPQQHLAEHFINDAPRNAHTLMVSVITCPGVSARGISIPSAVSVPGWLQRKMFSERNVGSAELCQQLKSGYI